MDCYIVRIYRRDENDAKKIIGLVESVGIEEKTPFKGTEELISILGNVKSGTKKEKQKG